MSPGPEGRSGPATSPTQGSRTQPPMPDLKTKLWQELRSLQLIWFLAQLSIIISTIHFLLLSNVFFVNPTVVYRRALKGVLIAYALVLFKVHGTIRFNAGQFQQLMSDDNSHYLLLAAFLLFSYPTPVNLIPFAVYAVVHSVNYFRRALLFYCVPSSSYSYIDAKLNGINNYQSQIMQVVAMMEIQIFIFLLWNTFRGRVFILSVLIYAQFLRLRYAWSPYVRQAFTSFRMITDRLFLQNSIVPLPVKSIYTKIVNGISRWGQQGINPAAASAAGR